VSSEQDQPQADIDDVVSDDQGEAVVDDGAQEDAPTAAPEDLVAEQPAEAQVDETVEEPAEEAAEEPAEEAAEEPAEEAAEEPAEEAAEEPAEEAAEEPAEEAAEDPAEEAAEEPAEEAAEEPAEEAAEEPAEEAAEEPAEEAGEAKEKTDEPAEEVEDLAKLFEKLDAKEAAEKAEAEEVEEVAEEAEELVEEPVQEPIEEEEIDESGMNWYILKVQVNREDSIRDALDRRVKMQGLEEFVQDIVVPVEEIAEFNRNGKRRIVRKKLYPGYIMVNMVINDDTWFLVRETPGIGDFTGSVGKPTPMALHEVRRIIKTVDDDGEEEAQVKTAIAFKAGDRIRVKDGYFQNFEGDVEDVDQANGRVTVLINIFNRSTPVELEHWQIENL